LLLDQSRPSLKLKQKLKLFLNSKAQPGWLGFGDR
jgi:hypothetical protein